MPAYNAEKTLERTYADVPKGDVDDIILVDDGSRDRTVEIARSLGIHIVVHEQNRGYGGNQKTCYRDGARAGRRHRGHGPSRPPVRSDRHSRTCYQALPSGDYDAAFGSRMLGRPADPGRHAEVEVPRQHPPDGDRERDVPDLPDRVPQRLSRVHAQVPRDRQPRGQLRRLRLRHRDHRAGHGQGPAHLRDPDRDALLRRGLADRLRTLGALRPRDPEDDAPLQAARLGDLVEPDLPGPAKHVEGRAATQSPELRPTSGPDPQRLSRRQGAAAARSAGPRRARRRAGRCGEQRVSDGGRQGRRGSRG